MACLTGGNRYQNVGVGGLFSCLCEDAFHLFTVLLKIDMSGRIANEVHSNNENQIQ